MKRRQEGGGGQVRVAGKVLEEGHTFGFAVDSLGAGMVKAFSGREGDYRDDV